MHVVICLVILFGNFQASCFFRVLDVLGIIMPMKR